MYEMITGKVPFDRPNSVNILMAHVNERVPHLREMNPNVQCGEAFEQAIYKCVEKNPDDRFKSMDEVLSALKRAGAATGSISGGGQERTGSFDMLSTTGSFTPQSNPMVGQQGSVHPLSPDSVSGSNPPVLGATASAAPEANKGSKTPLILGLGIAAAAAVAIVAILSGKPSNDPQPGTKSTQTAALTTPAAPTTPPTTSTDPAAGTASGTSAPSDDVVKVRIDSDPPGAVVKEDDTVICDQAGEQCQVIVSDKPRKLTLTLKDYKPTSISVKKGDPTRIVKLDLAPKWVPPPKKTSDNGNNGNGDFKPPDNGSWKPAPY